MSILDHGLVGTEKLKIFSNGQEVIEFLDELLGELHIENLDKVQAPRQPVALVLLDINMPILNGLDTLRMIKERYKKFDECRVIRPMLCYLS